MSNSPVWALKWRRISAVGFLGLVGHRSRFHHHRRATIGGAGVVGAAGSEDCHNGNGYDEQGFLFHIICF